MKTVILTNEKGESLGEEDIINAHTRGGKLHKAFSIFIFTPDRSKLLLQKRASGKMLFPEFWANTCCSHPQEMAPIEIEASNRLMEECGFRTAVSVVDAFIYKADDPSGRGTEYELDTVLVGQAEESTTLDPHPDEVMDMKWMEVEKLKEDMAKHPETYAPWLEKGLEVIGY